MIGFVIWSLLGVFIIGLGIKDMFSKNPVGFWANTETIKVKRCERLQSCERTIVYNLWNHFCYIRNSAVRWSKYTIRSVVGYWCDGGNNCNYGCL